MNPLPFDALSLPFGQAAFVIDATPVLGGLALLLAAGAVLVVGAAWRKRRTRTRLRALVVRLGHYAPDPLRYGASR